MRAQAGSCLHGFGGIVAHELLEALEALGVPEGFGIDAAIADDAVGEGVEQSEIALGLQRDVAGGGLGGLGGPGIDNDDFRAAFVAHDPLPEDRVGDAKVGPDEDDDVAFFKIHVGTGRRVETERLLVGGGGGGHTLPGVRIGMKEAHSEFEKAAK